MDYLQFIASLIGSLAWPIALVVLGVMFKEQLRTLLGKMKSLKAAGLEAAFAEETKKVFELQAKILPSVEMSALDSSMGKKFVPPTDMRPSAVIFESWLELEQAVADTIDELGIETKHPANIRNCLDALKDFLPTETRVFIAELEGLRNQVTHNSDLEPDLVTAYRYQISTKNLIESIRSQTDELQSHINSQHKQ